MAVTVVIAKNEIGLLMLGSYDRTKYLGDEDTTFIEYIRDVLEKKLEKWSMNESAFILKDINQYLVFTIFSLSD